ARRGRRARRSRSRSGDRAPSGGPAPDRVGGTAPGPVGHRLCRASSSRRGGGATRGGGGLRMRSWGGMPRASHSRRDFLAPASGAERPLHAQAGEPGAVTGEKTLERLLAQAREGRWSERAIGDRVGALGMALRRTPYVDGTLELYADREVCSVNLTGLDCVTF